MALMDDIQTLKIRCSNCEAILQYENGSFRDCPVCGMKPTEKQIRAAAYFQRVAQTGSVLSHEFLPKDDRPPEFVFVHPMSEHIPENSALIVEENQLAVFSASGRQEVLEPNLYPLIGDSRSVEERLMAIAAGERGLALRTINTRITFFDMREHRHRFILKTKIPGNQWEINVECDCHIGLYQDKRENGRIPANSETPGKLMKIDFDLKNRPTEVADYICRQAEIVISDKLVDMIRSFDGVNFRPGQNARQLAALLRSKLRNDEAMDQLTAVVAEKLREQGLFISNNPRVHFDWDHLICTDTSRMTEVHCTFTREISGEDHDCPGSNLVPIDDHTSWPCPVCGQLMQWCPHCRAFRTTCKRYRTCDVCRRVI
ncbi:MAG: hypothetical protein IJ041_07440 [Clostridia bacterium]|nr:hypothetical protein [Clostridia bacterium]